MVNAWQVLGGYADQIPVVYIAQLVWIHLWEGAFVIK